MVRSTLTAVLLLAIGVPFAGAADIRAADIQANGIQIEAFAGEPFGVAKMTVELAPDEIRSPDSPIQLTERRGRIFYPVFPRPDSDTTEGKEAATARRITAYFLFRGTEPLTVTLKTNTSRRATVEPADDESAHATMLRTWWGQYGEAARQVARDDLYPPLAENYLLATLARRLNLDAPKPVKAWSPTDGLDQVFSILTGAESVRSAAQSKVLLETVETPEKADRPLPKSVDTLPINLPKITGEVAIEPIAMHVPEECFYVRCGSFANFLWLRSVIDGWGTNLRDLISVRGLDYRIGPRIERQLALRETVLSRMFGDTVVSDVAILGTDTFLREGAAIGILFEARSGSALAVQISRQRQEALDGDEDVTQQTVEIGGRDVSLLSTEDNRVRSFYAVDGKYHLVTTSRTIVQRFFEAGAGERSLGKRKEFRWARSTMPVSQGHTAFIYLSDPFFRQLIGPEYRIEMTRRVRASAEIDVVRLAQLAARAEGKRAGTVDRLIADDFLPPRFGIRPDGSHVTIDGREVTDSLRGAYGSFLPIPDVEIAAATPSEVEAYEQFAKAYRNYWEKMDPVVVAVQRKSLKGGKERVICDVHVTPYARAHYGLFAMYLPKADEKSWTHAPGDIGTLQVNIQGSKYALGMRDFRPKFTIKNGVINREVPDDPDMPAYWLLPKKETVLLFGMAETVGPPDDDGSIRVKGGIPFGSSETWARDLGDYFVIAPNKKLLAEVAPNLKLKQAQRSAKARLWIGDLAETEVAAAIDVESYLRARKISGGNVAFMRMLEQQFHIPTARARSAAEELLDARLVCPLGGDYELKRGPDRAERWRSTAWQYESLYQVNSVPEEFRSPLLDWFAGVLIELNIDQDMLSTHIELDVRPKGR